MSSVIFLHIYAKKKKGRRDFLARVEGKGHGKMGKMVWGI
jgi:hypothetical protein